MKKEYTIPEFEIDRFLFEDVLTSSGLGTGDGATDNLDDVENPDPWL